MEFNEHLVLDKMEKEGGSFVKSLAECFRHADTKNFRKFKKTFPEYWDEYERRTK